MALALLPLMRQAAGMRPAQAASVRRGTGTAAAVPDPDRGGSDVRDRIVAISAYDDPVATAHRLRRLHEQWRSQDAVPQQVRGAIARAWARQSATSLSVLPGHVSDDEIARRRQMSASLRTVLPMLRDTLLHVAEEAGNELVVCDADGIVLWLHGPAQVLRFSQRLGFVEGARWSETAVGTNALGTALVDEAPVQVFGPEHSQEDHHSWVCTGAPIIDPGTRRPLGAITLSGPLRTAHPNTLALVTGAASMVGSLLRARHETGVNALAARAQTVTTPGPWVVVDAHGWVAAERGLRAPERVRLSGGARIGPVWSPALGALVAEPFAEGWLLRPGHEVTGLELRLGPEPIVRVCQEQGSAEMSLSARHAAILAALARATDGLSGEQLSAAAYDAPVSAVTVRAEVSRLRRRLGPYVLTRPYRLTVPCVIH